MVDVFDREHGFKKQSIVASETREVREGNSPVLNFHEKAQDNKKKGISFFRGTLCRLLERMPV